MKDLYQQPGFSFISLPYTWLSILNSESPGGSTRQMFLTPWEHSLGWLCPSFHFKSHFCPCWLPDVFLKCLFMDSNFSQKASYSLRCCGSFLFVLYAYAISACCHWCLKKKGGWGGKQRCQPHSVDFSETSHSLESLIKESLDSKRAIIRRTRNRSCYSRSQVEGRKWTQGSNGLDRSSQPPEEESAKLVFDLGNTLVVFLESPVPVLSTVSGSVFGVFRTCFSVHYVSWCSILKNIFPHVSLCDVSTEKPNQSFCFYHHHHHCYYDLKGRVSLIPISNLLKSLWIFNLQFPVFAILVPSANQLMCCLAFLWNQ